MSAYASEVARVLESGIEPLTLEYEVVKSFSGEKKILRTGLCINSLDLGVLTPVQYRFVARRSMQGAALVVRQVKKLLAVIPALKKINKGVYLFTIPAYARIVKNGTLYQILSDALLCNQSVSPDSIGVELSSDVLYEEPDQILPKLEQLAQLGVKLVLCELGDEFCPVMRLAQMRFDLAFLDATSANKIGDEGHDVMLGALIQMLHAAGVGVYACGLEERPLQEIEAVGCDGYSFSQTFTTASEEVSV
ncbi:MAG: EAL domain-containing protein [Clostridia bacterium]|nr:EAL domain-containing protein [Clostridia bacterium]